MLLPNPSITANTTGLTVSLHAHQLTLNLSQDQARMICTFQHDGHNQSAAVTAPLLKYEHFAKRITSFISAYLRVTDASTFELDLERTLQNHTRSNMSPTKTHV